MHILNMFSIYFLQNVHCNQRTTLNIPLNANLSLFKNPFFPSTIIEWNKLDLSLKKAEGLSIYKTNILKFQKFQTLSTTFIILIDLSFY